MQLTFPIRSRPIKGEALKGYALRLAWLNGFSSIADIQVVVGTPARFTSLKCSSKFIDALAETILMKGYQLRDYFNSSLNIAVDSSRAIMDIRVSQLRVCPECMKEKIPYIREEWMLAHTTHCLEHDIRLIDVCPKCNTPLAWKANLFEGCLCGFRWDSYASESEGVPAYLEIEKNLIEEDKADYLRVLYKALTHVLRPYDLTYDVYRTFPNNLSNLGTLFEQAYKLCSHQPYYDQWVSVRCDFFQNQSRSSSLFEALCHKLQPKIKCLEQSNSLQKKQVSLPALTTQYPEAISKFRQKYLHDNSLAWEQINIDDVAKILNLSHATIAYLVAQKHIKVLNNAKAIHHFLFSIQDIVQFMANIYRHAVKAKNKLPYHISLHELAEKAPLFDLRDRYDLGGIVEVIVQSSLPRILPYSSSHSIHNVLFDKEALLFELEEYFVNLPYVTASRVRLREICGLSELQYVTFLEVWGEKFDGKHIYISERGLKEFFSNHILVNRWCMLRDLELQTVLDQLNSGRDDFLHPSLVSKGIFILRKTSSNLRKLKYIATACSD